jgi:hypothetical protein
MRREEAALRKGNALGEEQKLALLDELRDIEGLRVEMEERLQRRQKERQRLEQRLDTVRCEVKRHRVSCPICGRRMLRVHLHDHQRDCVEQWAGRKARALELTLQTTVHTDKAEHRRRMLALARSQSPTTRRSPVRRAASPAAAAAGGGGGGGGGRGGRRGEALATAARPLPEGALWAHSGTTTTHGLQLTQATAPGWPRAELETPPRGSRYEPSGGGFEPPSPSLLLYAVPSMPSSPSSRLEEFRNRKAAGGSSPHGGV